MEGLSAAAAAAATFVAPSGHTLLVSPYTVQMLATIEEEALRSYKRERVRTFRDNIDAYGSTEAEQAVALRSEIDRLADMLPADLPNKEMSLPKLVPEVDDNGKPLLDDKGVQKKKLVNVPRELPYVQWWLLTSLEGRTLSCWLACRRHEPHLTREEFERHFDDGPGAMNDLSDVVADVNQSRLRKKNETPTT